MSVNGYKRWIVGGAVALAGLSGGTVAASAYPPGDPTPSTVATGGVAGIRQPDPADVELAATGSDSGTTLLVAGAAVASGAGLLVAARMRRRAPAV